MRRTRFTRSRVIVAIIVGGAHVGVLLLIQQTHYTRKTVVEEIESIYVFSPDETISRRAYATDKPAAHLQPLHDLTQGISESSSAPLLTAPLVTPSSAPDARPRVDWQQAVDSVAADVLEQAKKDVARVARMREPPPSPSFQPLHERPHDYEWISRHSHLVINARGVPEWVLIQPCAEVILRNEPDCTVEHIEPHGPMLEYMQQQHQATVDYGGPNAVP